MGAPFTPSGLARLTDAIRREVDARRIPGAALALATRDRVVLDARFGFRDAALTEPLPADALFRIYSMTKPIVSVGAMMLMESGQLAIGDPVAAHLPEFAELRLGRDGAGATGATTLREAPAAQPMTVCDLLRHTAGLTYGQFGDSALKRLYRDSRIGARNTDNATMLRTLAGLPLAFEPGTVWEYSHATDVLGALIERVAGRPLDEYLRARILEPLGMRDTAFWVDAPDQPRIAEPFAADPVTGQAVRLLNVTRRPAFLSGGAGLVSSTGDYLRFARMLLAGGALDGIRIVSRKTVALMTSDHLAELPAARSGPDYLPGPGYGFGLGFAVRVSPAALTPGSVGDYNWSGLAGSYFWVDPVEGFVAVWMMQAPEQRARFRQLLRTLVYAALE